MRFSSRITLLSILALAFCLRCIWLDTQSLGMDEIAELNIAKLPAGEIVWHPDSMPPGYSLLLKCVLAVFPHDIAARWLSVLIGTASILCVWGAGSELIDKRTGLVAALITSLLPLHLLYSQYVRSYILLFFFVALCFWLLLRALNRKHLGDWAGFVLAAVGGACTHYYFAIFLVTAVVLTMLWQKNFWIGSRALLAFAAIGLCCLPLLWILPSDFHFQKNLRDPQPFGIASYGYTYFSFFSGYSLGPSRGELHTLSTSAAARGAAPWIILLGIPLLLIGHAGIKELLRQQRAALVMTFLCLPPLLIGMLGYIAGVNYHVRFVLWCMLPLAILLGVGMTAGWQTKYIKLASVGLLILSGIAIGNRNYVARYQHEDFRSVAAYLKTQSPKTETIFVVSDYLADLLRYYGEQDWQIVELPTPGEASVVIRSAADVKKAAAVIATKTPDSKSYWLIYSRPFHGDPEHLLLDRLSQSESFACEKEFAGVAVYRNE